MPNLSGMSPITIKLTDTLLQLASRLRAGQPIQATVSGTAEEPFVQVANQRVPLPLESNVRPGDSVIVRVEQQPDGPRIVISPAPAHTGGQATPSNLSSSTLDVLTRIIQELAKELPTLKSLTAQQQTALVPSRLPAVGIVVRLALEVFQLRQAASLSEARAVVVAALRGASVKGGQSELIAQVSALLGAEVDAADVRALEQLVRASGEQAMRSPLATLQAMGSAGAAQLDTESAGLYHLLSLMRNDAAVLTALGGDREVQQFQSATDTLRDHVAGQSLQNARSLEMPYMFLSLPLGEVFERAQLHVFGEGRSDESGSGHESGTLVLDLEMSKLGSLWLEVRHRGDQCACQFFVASEAVAMAIQSASAELVTRLEASAFARVTVQATADDRKRAEALAALLGPMSGLDLRA